MPESVPAHGVEAAGNVKAIHSTRTERHRIAPLIALIVAAVLGGLFWVLAATDPSEANGVSSYLIGRPAPQVQSTTLDGKPFDLSRRKGSWVVLNFFNSTCLPCKAEHPELVKFRQQQQTLGVDGAELYTVINDDTDQAVTAWFAEHGGNWPIVTDDNGTISIAFGVAQVPETWIIDPQGVVRRRIATTVTAAELTLLIQQLRDGRR